MSVRCMRGDAARARVPSSAGPTAARAGDDNTNASQPLFHQHLQLGQGGWVDVQSPAACARIQVGFARCCVVGAARCGGTGWLV